MYGYTVFPIIPCDSKNERIDFDLRTLALSLRIIEGKMGSVRIFKTPVMINGKFVNKKEDRISCMTQSLDKLEDKCKDLVETFMKIFKYGTDRILMTGKNDGEIICSDGIKLISKTDFSGILIPNGCRIVMTNWREDEKPGKGSTMTDIKVLFNTILKVDEILEVTDFGRINCHSLLLPNKRERQDDYRDWDSKRNRR